MPAIVVKGCKLEVVSPGTGKVTVTSEPSDQIFVDDNGVFFKEIQFKVENSNGGPGNPIGNNDGKGTGSIIATGSTALSGEDKVVLLGDVSATVDVKGTTTTSSGTVPAFGAVTVKVVDAGQTDVEAASAMRLAATSALEVIDPESTEVSLEETEEDN